MSERNDVPPPSVSEAAPVDALTAMALERDEALRLIFTTSSLFIPNELTLCENITALVEYVKQVQQENVALRENNLSVKLLFDMRAEAAEATVATLTQERDHERHEKETISDAMQAYARWSRCERGRLEATVARLRDALLSLVNTHDALTSWAGKSDPPAIRHARAALAGDAAGPSHPAPATVQLPTTNPQSPIAKLSAARDEAIAAWDKENEARHDAEEDAAAVSNQLTAIVSRLRALSAKWRKESKSWCACGARAEVYDPSGKRPAVCGAHRGPEEPFDADAPFSGDDYMPLHMGPTAEDACADDLDAAVTDDEPVEARGPVPEGRQMPTTGDPSTTPRVYPGAAQAAPNERTPQDVTRFEVIDHRRPIGQSGVDTGRVYSVRQCRIELSYQDGGKTLKVFVDGARPTAPIEGETALNAKARAYMAESMGMTEPYDDQEQNFILSHLVTFAAEAQPGAAQAPQEGTE